MTSSTTDRRLGLNGGTAIKAPCLVATTANITLSGEQTIDGVAVVTDDRVLVKDQTDQTTNGIYDVSTSTWTRSLDFDGNLDVVHGTIVTVLSGTTNSNTAYKVSASDPITIDSSNITFAIGTFSDASSVAYTPHGNIASTTVQSAISEEVDDLAASTGASLIGFIQSGTGAVATNVQSILRSFVMPEQFGAVGDGVTDDTTALNNATTAAIAQGKGIYLSKIYGVTKWSLTSLNTLNILSNGGGIIGLATSTQTSLFEIKDSSSIFINGWMIVNANYNTYYTVGVQVYGATSAQFMDLRISVIAAQIAWRFGDSSYPDAIISEITVHGGHTYGCPGICEVIGTQTVITTMGQQWQSETGGGTGSWLTLERFGIRSIGGYINVVGGECLMTNYSTGILSQIRPITSVSYDNRYGSIVFTATNIETASPLGQAHNPSSVSSPATGTGLLTYINCVGYNSGDTGDFIAATSSDFTGTITALNNNFFGTGSAKSNYIISATGACNIIYDGISFTRGFKSSLTGVSASNASIDLRETVVTTWTPVLTFTTPGDLSVTYTSQSGREIRNGRQVTVTGEIITSAFTHTTASGSLRITGLNNTAKNVATNFAWIAGCNWSGITSSYTDIQAAITNNTNYVVFPGSASAVGQTNVAASDMPTGGTVIIRFSLTYEV